MRVVWSRRALRDLRRIRDHIEQFNPRAAERVATRLWAAGTSLEHFPRRGRPGRRGNTRELIVVGTPYFLVYRVTGDLSEIATIVHGRQDYPPGGQT